MEKLLSIKSALLTFVLFPLGLPHTKQDVRELRLKLEELQGSGQEEDNKNMASDWENVGGYIKDALAKVEHEQQAKA